MSFGTWIKSAWNKFMALFTDFIKQAINDSTKLLIGEFSQFAVSTVTTLAATDLTSEAKRIEAFKKIQDEAKARGKELSSNVTNLLIELAVAKIKQTVTK